MKVGTSWCGTAFHHRLNSVEGRTNGGIFLMTICCHLPGCRRWNGEGGFNKTKIPNRQPREHNWLLDKKKIKLEQQPSLDQWAWFVTHICCKFSVSRRIFLLNKKTLMCSTLLSPLVHFWGSIHHPGQAEGFCLPWGRRSPSYSQSEWSPGFPWWSHSCHSGP